MTETQKLSNYNIRYTRNSDLTTKRVKHGTGFRYVNSHGAIKNREYVKEIKKLPIPPSWHDVVISSSLNTHILAIGLDDRGRKQYFYHENWKKMQQEHKFHKMIFFGEVLPHIRAKVHADINERGLKRERVLGTVVWLLEHTFIRVGNEEYAKDNKTYGLTTIKNKHVEIKGDTVTFQFKGKSGVYHAVQIHDPKVAKIMYKCQELPEQELFEYIDDAGNRRDIGSSDVNAYLKEITGETISAKDFRTWGGTVFAADTLHKKGDYTLKTEAKKNISDTVKMVSKHLQNTTTVCRHYYIHPKIIKTYEDKYLVSYFDDIYRQYTPHRQFHKYEYATWELLKQRK